MFTIGCHLSIARGFAAAARDAASIGANTFQFFTRNPRGGKAKPLDPDDLAAFSSVRDESGIGCILAHAPYTLNPSSDKASTREFALQTLSDDLDRMERIMPGQLYNMHPGAHVGQGADAAIEMIAGTVNAALRPEHTTTLLLETMAGKGSEVGRTFEEIAAILDRIEMADRVGVCLDTCHIWDGGYDIAGDLDGVLAEFDRVIGLERLRAAGVAVHAIALSADADHELLQALADRTDGSFEQADSAEELQRLFLRLFERTVRRDTLPLNDNRFSVDASISELTLLAFRAAGSGPAQLVTPSGRTLIKDELPAGVRWHHEPGYDLVTVENPEPGEWRLLAEVDPDNRVMIVTDLKLATSELPNQLIAGESLPLVIRLTEGGETIDRSEFLAFTQVKVEQQQAGAAPRLWVLKDDAAGDDRQAGDGVYALRLGPSLLPGEHTFIVTVDGTTFSRERRLATQVAAEPLRIDARPLPADGPFGYEIELSPTLDWLDRASLGVAARLTRGDGSSEQLAVPNAGDGWLLRLDTLDPAHDHRLELELTGRTQGGRAFHVVLPVLELAAAPAIEAPAELEETNWLLIIAVVVVANLALVGLTAGAYFWYRRRRRGPPRFDDQPAAPATPQR